jgi:hypothetical protein
MPDVLGYRAKIGVLVPSTNMILESELYAMAPHGVTFHTSRRYVPSPLPPPLGLSPRMSPTSRPQIGDAGAGRRLVKPMATQPSHEMEQPVEKSL